MSADKPSLLTTPAGKRRSLGTHRAGVRRKVANPVIKTKPSAVPAPFNGPAQATSPGGESLCAHRLTIPGCELAVVERTGRQGVP